MRTIIIYDMHPEEIQIFSLPEHEDAEWVVKCHGMYLNSSEMDPDVEEACNRLSDALSPKLEYCSDPEDPLAAKWAQYQVDGAFVVDEPVRVIHTGFLL